LADLGAREFVAQAVELRARLRRLVEQRLEALAIQSREDQGRVGGSGRHRSCSMWRCQSERGRGVVRPARRSFEWLKVSRWRRLVQLPRRAGPAAPEAASGTRRPAPAGYQ